MELSMKFHIQVKWLILLKVGSIFWKCVSTRLSMQGYLPILMGLILEGLNNGQFCFSREYLNISIF